MIEFAYKSVGTTLELANGRSALQLVFSSRDKSHGGLYITFDSEEVDLGEGYMCIMFPLPAIFFL